MLIGVGVLVLWRGGWRGVAVILPSALALLWFTDRGDGDTWPVIIGTWLLLLATAALGTRRLVRASLSRERPAGPEPWTIPASAPRRRSTRALHFRTESESLTQAIARAERRSAEGHADPDVSPGRSRPEGATIQSIPRPLPRPSAPERDLRPARTPVLSFPDSQPAAAASPLEPARPVTDVLGWIARAAPAAIAEELGEALGAPGERVALLRDRAVTGTGQRLATGRAARAQDRPFGNQRLDGLLLRFEGRGPGDATVLAVPCELETERPGPGPRLLALVTVEQPAVKRLDPPSTPRARWVAREVFVPGHLVLEEARGVQAGAGRLRDLVGANREPRR